MKTANTEKAYKWTRSALATEMLNLETKKISYLMGGLVACEADFTDPVFPVAYCVGFSIPADIGDLMPAIKACSRAVCAYLDGTPWEVAEAADHAMPGYGGGYGLRCVLRRRKNEPQIPDSPGYEKLKNNGTPYEDLRFLRQMWETPWYPEIEAHALARA